MMGWDSFSLSDVDLYPLMSAFDSAKKQPVAAFWNKQLVCKVN